MLIQWFRLVAHRVLHQPHPNLRALVLLMAVITYGATGFFYFEGPQNPELDWLTAFWYSLVTVTTVGYGDYAPSTLGGRYVVAVPLMFVGIGLLGYMLSLSASAIVEANAKELSGMRTVKAKRHLVLFNFPSLGKVERVIDELRGDADFVRSGTDIVLVDENLEKLPPELLRRGVHYVRGNPSRDETLSRANLDQAARAIVLSREPGEIQSDAVSLAITLAIEARNPAVTTVVECVDPGTEELLRKAGSDRIVCTSRFDARLLSQEMLNPGVQEVIAQLTSNLQGQQVYLTRCGAELTFKQADGRCREAGHILLGVRSEGGLVFNPSPAQQLTPSSQLVTIGASRLEL